MPPLRASACEVQVDIGSAAAAAATNSETSWGAKWMRPREALIRGERHAFEGRRLRRIPSTQGSLPARTDR